MNDWILFSLVAAAMGTALISGLLFSFSSCVMKALSRLPPD